METSPLIVSDIGSPAIVLGVHGGKGVMWWKRFMTGLTMYGAWESFEYDTLEVGAAVGDHTHSRTEELYFIVSGLGRMHYNDQLFDVGPGDIIMSPLNTTHGLENTGDVPLEWVVVEAVPPQIEALLPRYAPAVVQEG